MEQILKVPSDNKIPILIKNMDFEKKIKILEQYLIEFYSGIVPENIDGYYDPVCPEFLDEKIDDPLGLKDHKFHRNNIELLNIDEGFPKAHKDINGKIVAVQLRKITSDKLLLGCGNNPTSICYHFPQSLEFNKECYSYGSSKWWSDTIIEQHKNDLNIGKTHQHNEYITIDPNITMNPTIVGFFGWYTLPESLIPNNSLRQIISEGIDLRNMRYFRPEYERLTGKPFSIEDTHVII